MTNSHNLVQPEVWSQFEEQLAYVKLTDEDRDALRKLETMISPKLPEIIDRFYEHLQSFPFCQSFLFDSQHIHMLKAAQLEYFRELLKGNFDAQYYANRRVVGDSHVQRGMHPKWYLGGYAFYCDLLFPILQNIYQGDSRQMLSAQIALIKTFFLDIQIAIESYIHNYADELVEMQNALEKKLWMEDRLLSLILSEATDAIVGLDEQDRICTWSQGAQRIFGYKTNEILDKSFIDLAVNRDITESLKAEAKEKSVAHLQGAYWIDRDKILIDADATLTYLIGRRGDHIGSTLIIQDRTEAREMAEKVKSMEQLTAMTKITAGVAHEIRTPLGVIALTSDILKKKVSKILNRNDIVIEEDEKENVTDLITDLQTEVDRMNEIIDHYLVLSRIRQPRKTRTCLQPFLKTIMDELARKNNNRSIQWELRAQDDLHVDIDTDQFRRIFHNLNDNSLHAIQGNGVIHITAFSEDNHVLIMFQDNGIGIEKENLRGVFSAFVTYRSGGTGLGLYLVREIVEAHQGSVSIESEQGKGTAVIITLPLTPNEG